MKKYLIAFIFLIVVITSGLFYFRYEIYYSHGNTNKNIIFEIKKGEGNAKISANLKQKGIISGKIYFWIYLKSHNLLNKIYPGEYLLNGKMTIPEIAVVVTNQKKVYEKVLFTEGMTARLIGDELKKHGFDGDAFLSLANNPTREIISQFSILAGKPDGSTLEGYLFPDTYYFSREATVEGILKKILANTDAKITDELRGKIKSQGKTIFEILTMASIIEKEVASDEDRAIVSGVFWNRINVGQPLQSDATLSFILNDVKSQHTFEETRINSPYNTYINKGFPPGPISNPGLSSILAAVNPKDTNYNYFLSDPSTGQTIFSETYEKHTANKIKYGL